jgi:hypothetical protein
MTQPPGRSRRRRLVCLRSGLRPSLRHTKRIGPQPSHEHWYRDRGGVTFQAEYQNEPVRPTLTVAGLDREQLAKRSIPLRRGIRPNSHTTLTAAIDIEERVLFWAVASWATGYAGHLVAYGTHPEQPEADAIRPPPRRFRGHAPGGTHDARRHAPRPRMAAGGWHDRPHRAACDRCQVGAVHADGS